MTLAAILVVFFLSIGSLGCQSQAEALPQSQPSSTSSEKPAAGSSLPSNPSQTPDTPVKKSHHKKKSTEPGCSSAPVKASAVSGTGAADDGKVARAEQKPCPTPKVVIKNGGSDEPAVNLKGDSNAVPGSSPESTEDLMVAADDNLRKLAGRELDAGQHETVSKIKEFISQAKAAVAAGDVERGHNLAVKARLLSDELVKP